MMFSIVSFFGTLIGTFFVSFLGFIGGIAFCLLSLLVDSVLKEKSISLSAVLETLKP